MSAPAQRSVQEIAREAATQFIVNRNANVSRQFSELEVTILHAIAEAVKATGAREALSSCHTWQAGDGYVAKDAPVIYCFDMTKVGTALAALDELGKDAE